MMSGYTGNDFVGSSLTGFQSSATYTGVGRRRCRDEDDYFDEDDAEPLYQPGPDSPAADQRTNGGDDDGEEDPLDSFMSGVEAEVQALDRKSSNSNCNIKGTREDLEAEDEMESYLKFMQDNPHLGVLDDDEEIYEYDAEGNIVERAGSKEIDPLPAIDHTTLDYLAFEKNFYTIHPEIAAMSDHEVWDLRRKLGLKVQGVQPPKPICSFEHLGLEDKLMQLIINSEFSSPTPIQSQGCPAALSGRDVIGIAKTGSGKTMAFIWPLIMHLLDQPQLKPGDGPIGLICAPTRELAQQIFVEARKFGKPYGVNVICAYGGGSLWEQQKACEAGCEILVCTPGRLIDLVKKKSTNLKRVTYLVFDEADKMFNLGFEPQVRSIANHVRPDRQTLFFSATFKRRIERLCRDVLTDPVRIVQGEIGEANEDVTQHVELMRSPEEKLSWLLRQLPRLCSTGQVLVFVTRKANSADLTDRLNESGFRSTLIHGDMHQSERNQVITAFKKSEYPILVATDVASRGLDIPGIRTVVNYESARDIDTHTHRVGRTGRAGNKGDAYTLLVVGKDKDFAGHLVRNLEAANQPVSPELMQMAMQNPWFKQSRAKMHSGLGKRVSGANRQRPGLGSSPAPANYAPTDRVGAAKDAFKKQYERMFVSAGIQGSTVGPKGAAGPTEPKRQRKSRWGD